MNKLESAPLSETEIEQTIETILKLFDAFPLAYKIELRANDWWMVISGIKAATDLFYIGDIYREDDIKKLKAACESVGLKISEFTPHPTTNGPIMWQALVYNPRALERETTNSSLIGPYSVSQTIDEWTAQQKASGVNEDVIAGKYYSFPESAILDLFRQDLPENKTRERFTGLFDDSYWYFLPAQPDVIAREDKKQIFMNRLVSDSRIIAMLKGDTLRKSIKLWNSLLPEELRWHTESHGGKFQFRLNKIKQWLLGAG